MNPLQEKMAFILGAASMGLLALALVWCPWLRIVITMDYGRTMWICSRFPLPAAWP